MKRKLTRTQLRSLLLREIRLLKEEEHYQPLAEDVVDALSALKEFNVNSVIKGDDIIVEGRSKEDGKIKFIVTFPAGGLR
tara:strand:- start:333 stop:572 length:240 start_codon:yes stop_codon:yes gene_type:complete